MSIVSRPPASTLAWQLRQSIARGVRAGAFWAAVILPVAYVPVLLGLVDGVGVEAFIALVAVHAVCIVVGHDHTPSRASTRDRH